MSHQALATLVVLTLVATLTACKQESEATPQETTTQTSALETTPPDDTQTDKGKPTVEVVNEEGVKGTPVYLASIEKDRITVSFHDVKDKERPTPEGCISQSLEALKLLLPTIACNRKCLGASALGLSSNLGASHQICK